MIDLRDGTRDAPRLPPGSMIAEGQSTLDQLEQQARELADQSTTLLRRANEIVEHLVVITEPTKFDGVTEVIAQARLMTGRLAQTSATLEAMVAENRVTLRRTLEAVHATATRTTDRSADR